MRLKYTIYDTARKRWLCDYRIPDGECDAWVTHWTREERHAMRFPGTKSARRVAQWIGENGNGGCVVLNAKGEIV